MTLLSGSVRKHLGVALINIYYRLLAFITRRARKYQLLLSYLLSLKIRSINPDARQEGADEVFDTVVHLVRLRMTLPHVFESGLPKFFFEGIPEQLEKSYRDRRAEYKQNQAAVDKLENQALERDDIKEILANYFLTGHLIHSITKQEERALWEFERARRYKENYQKIEAKQIGKLTKAVKTDLRMTQATLADREAVKIDISLQTLGYILAFLSPLFLFTGYLYNRIFFAEFGINSSHYFSVSDYILSSIDEIRYAALLSVFGVVFCFMGFHSASRKSVAQIKFEQNRPDTLKYVIYFLVLNIFIVGVIAGPPRVYHTLSFLTYFLSLPICAHISRRYFANPTAVLFLMIFTVSYLSTIFGALYANIYEAKNGQLESANSLYEFSDELHVKTASMVLIGANSRFFFFYDTEEKGSLVVPEGMIRYVRVIAPDRQDMYERGKAWLAGQFEAWKPERNE